MEISELVSPRAVTADLKVTCKRQALQELSHQAASLTGLDKRAILDVLLDRERLGTTGVGHGIAVPHGRMKQLQKIHGLFARLEHPVDFEAVDSEPVDLIFLLLAPEGAGAEHLKALARVSRLLRDQGMRDRLRASPTREAIYALLTERPARAA
ncbi:MAG: PTS IIA-like nitrogen-regulatory protein PtsN [Alphaproteobacteria bacterium]|nr:PTS IIA-like nitrogen-regulatory protein PtsN [Alphaproteobacteria bacterium]